MAEEELNTEIADLSRSYGTNWVSVNVRTLFEWVHIAAFNIRCLEYTIQRYRGHMRRNMILNLILSTASGTLSVGFFGGYSSSVEFIIKVLLTLFSFLIAIGSGTLKIYQIQERLESAIRTKQDWIVFSAKITSELQLPKKLRRDGIWMIKQNKEIYLDLMKTETEIPESIKSIVAKELPHPDYLHLDRLSLPRIMIDVTTSEMNNAEVASLRKTQKTARRASALYTGNTNAEVPSEVTLTVIPPPTRPTLRVPADSPPVPPPSYSALSPSQSQPPQGSERPL